MSFQAAKTTDFISEETRFSQLPFDLDALEYLKIDENAGNDMVLDTPEITSGLTMLHAAHLNVIPLRNEIYLKIEATTNTLTERKERYYLRGLENLLRRSNYLNLCLQLAENDISEGDFDIEVESNPLEYIVEMGEIQDKVDIQVIGEIVAKMGRDFSVDDVEDIFGVGIE